MLKKLMVLAGMLAMLLVATAPALAQPTTEEAEVVGVISPNPDALIPGGEPTSHLITEDGTGDVYMISSYTQGVDLSQYEGQFVTIYGIFQTQGNPISNFDDLTEVPISVTEVYPDYDSEPEAEVTGRIQPVAEPMVEGPTHTITETGTGDVYGLWSDTVDLTQYEGTQSTIYGIFQTQGAPISDFEDPTDVLIAVNEVKLISEASSDEPPAEEPPAEGQYQGVGTTTGEPPAEDQYQDAGTITEEPAEADDTDSDGGIVSVLPDTGGFSPAAIGLVALLIGGGGLLTHGFIRQR